MKKKAPKPWSVAEKLLLLTANRYAKHQILGDCEEEFHEIAETKSAFRAHCWYWTLIFISLPSFFANAVYWNFTMLKNYVKTSLRNIRKQKIYSCINIAGLAVGMAACILILLWVNDELSYDSFNENVNDLHLIRKNFHYANGEVTTSTGLPGPLGPALKEDFPEIADATRFFNLGEMLLSYENNKFYETGIAGVDSSFLTMFTFPLVKGDPETALDEPLSIILSESMALKYFRDEDPVGKTISINNRFDVQVTGVMGNVPNNSHMQFEFLIPFDFTQYLVRNLQEWGFFWCSNYVLLNPGVNLQDVNEKIAGYVNTKLTLETRPEIFLVPLSQYHLYEESGGIFSILVRAFSIIAVLILVIACINFTNLSTARSLNRAKEVGIRKIVGAYRKQLIRQFLGESLVISIIAFAAAVVLVYMLLPHFNTLTQKQLAPDWTDLRIILSVVGIIGLTGLFSGGYPALFLSSFRPVRVLKGISSTGANHSKLRKFLVVSQFSISIIFMIFTVFVFKQLTLVRDEHWGFDKEHVIEIPLKGAIQEQTEIFKQQALQNPDIKNITMCHNRVTFISSGGWYWNWPGKDPDVSLSVCETSVDLDFGKTLNMTLADGRFFSEEFPSDRKAVVINEEAVRAMNLADPVGQILKQFDKEFTVIGVVRDFKFLPVIEKMKPMILMFREFPSNYLYVKTVPGAEQETVGFLEQLHNELNPDFPFEHIFLEDDQDMLYQLMNPIGTIIYAFTFLALFISCLGLFGLSSYMAVKRTKEIGIRKTLGASTSKIVALLSKEFIQSVVVANIIALPLAYLAVREFLGSFAYRVEIDYLSFTAAGLLALCISVLTVSIQSSRAASANPVDSLRYE
ncbi:ABC transporter permease [candidate division KSB1 bacterium]